MRTISEEEQRSLKGSTDAAYRLGGGVTLFTLLTRVNISTLSKYASLNEENDSSFIPVDVAIEADRQAKSPIITSTMAALLGYRLEAADTAPRRAVTRDDAVVLSIEVGDVIRELHSALADGHVDSGEKKRLLKEIDEAMRELQQLRNNLTGA